MRSRGTSKGACQWCTHAVSLHAPDPLGRKGKIGACTYGTGIGTTHAICECTGSRPKDPPAARRPDDLLEALTYFVGGFARLATDLHAALVAAKNTEPKRDPFALSPWPAYTRSSGAPTRPSPLLDRGAAFHGELRAEAPAKGPRKVAEKGERKVLTALAQHPDGLTSDQIAVFTDYASTARGEYLAALQRDERIQRVGRMYQITTAGLAWLGPFERLPEGDELRAYWLDKLNERESTVLAAVAGVYPRTLTLAEIRERTSYGQTSAGEAVAILRRRNLIVKDGRTFTASGTLFNEGHGDEA